MQSNITQPENLLLRTNSSAGNKDTSEVISTSEQCDSLGPNTEKILLGSLLTPDEESILEDISGEVELHLQMVV